MNILENKKISEMSDEQLIDIVRKSENTYVPGSRYNLAKTELELRYSSSMLDLVSNNNGGVVIKSQGDMINNGTIITNKGGYVNLETKGKYTSDRGKIIQNNKSPRRWWEYGWFQVIALMASIFGIISFIIYIL